MLLGSWDLCPGDSLHQLPCQLPRLSLNLSYISLPALGALSSLNPDTRNEHCTSWMAFRGHYIFEVASFSKYSPVAILPITQNHTCAAAEGMHEGKSCAYWSLYTVGPGSLRTCKMSSRGNAKPAPFIPTSVLTSED